MSNTRTADEMPDAEDHPDGTLTSITYRVAEYLRTRGQMYERQEFAPHGRWVMAEDKVTRKVWEGYDTRVVLETDLKPGAGWRVYQDPPGEDGILGITPESSMDQYDTITVWIPDSPDKLPRHPRKVAFRAAERAMTHAANDHGGRFPDPDDE